MALGFSLEEIYSLNAAEVFYWADYVRFHGFPIDRLMKVIANVGAYLGGLWGGSKEPDDLIPSYGPRREARKAIISLSSSPGVSVRDGRRK